MGDLGAVPAVSAEPAETVCGVPDLAPDRWDPAARAEIGERVEGERPYDGAAPDGRGFRDRPLSEFRARHESAFVEPMARPYPVERFSDPDEVVRAINPDLGDPSGLYDVNCADCARSVERTWRGEHEEAAGVRSEGEESGITEEWAGEPFRPTPDADALRTRLLEGGHGSSAIVHTRYDWDGDRLGHAYNVVNHHGSIRVLDGQTGENLGWQDERIHPGLGLRPVHRAMAWDARGGRIW